MITRECASTLGQSRSWIWRASRHQAAGGPDHLGYGVGICRMTSARCWRNGQSAWGADRTHGTSSPNTEGQLTMSESHPSAEFTFNKDSEPPQLPQTPKADPLADALDFSFSKYATPGIMRTMFIIAGIGVALIYAIQVVTWFIVGPFLGFVAVIVGAVVSIFMMLTVRVGLEVALANVQSAMDIRTMKDKYVGPTV